MTAVAAPAAVRDLTGLTAAVEDPAALDALRLRVGDLAGSAPFPPALESAVRAAYERLPDPEERGAVVAVRSSAVGEDGTDDSFAGMNVTFTHVCGVDRPAVASAERRVLLDAARRGAVR
ncbi:PEP/pyruvate-binding domain-containing protein [Pseudonocardia abyssalis]|jgi:pyruvate,water dikinase|uniref:Pyruvate phosphate dikinase AMP/ATP-binding domain-containing protein n=1 Tax=Pseudonocardia abyssalis TaxID=2792008 RepID=A0ABS6UPF2_9PSEU|nr:PEP/pyruvate-binding domain-containing protein [Pseudonocardia abyssalis]MBW0116581.1 hypothetical protein [Pseudonocardia abyssalis]MBW0133783.1 hypothetical protein [Pseudonocardia abyssalis]